MLQALYHLCGPPLDSFQEIPFLYRGAQNWTQYPVPATCGFITQQPSSPQSPGVERATVMATVVVEIDLEPSCSIPNPTSSNLSHRFLDNKFYLLVVIGELVTEEHLRQAIANIERARAATHIYRRPLAGCRELGEEQHKHELQNLFTYHFMRGLSSRLTARPSYSPSRPVAYERRGAAVRSYGMSPLRLTAVAPRCQPYKDPQSSACAVPQPPLCFLAVGEVGEPPPRHCRGGSAGAPARTRCLPTPSARRHRRVGVVQSALRSLWQPRADKGHPRCR
ncbi:Microtubule-associated protein 1B [Aix galericulata]|nr:Microtubule-associated protein 1B [Aix galericulata]